MVQRPNPPPTPAMVMGQPTVPLPPPYGVVGVWYCPPPPLWCGGGVWCGVCGGSVVYV